MKIRRKRARTTYTTVQAELGGKQYTFRSKLEYQVAAALVKQGCDFTYEKDKIKYEIPTKNATYTPDIVLPNGIIIEIKGYFTSADRVKMKLVKKSNPDLDIRLLFARAGTKLNKTSKTTYGAWAESHGFQYAEKFVPKLWLEERPNDKAAI